MTILRALALYGKTTFLSSWLKNKEEAIAWVSLDAADNDPIRYWTYAVHAVAKAYQAFRHNKLRLIKHVRILVKKASPTVKTKHVADI